MAHYVTFEQAKLIKSKGGIKFDSNRYYTKKGELRICQTFSQAYHSIVAGRGTDVPAPTQSDVVEWVRVNHGIWVDVTCDVYGNEWFATLAACSEKTWNDSNKRHDIYSAHREFYKACKKPHEAYEGAFDYILTNLI